jgi:hypothetical protein
LVAWLEDQVAGLGVDDLVAEQRSQPPLEHVAVLILALVNVEWGGEVTRGDRVLDQREVPAGFVSVDHEANPDGPQVARLSVLGADDLWLGALRCCLHLPLLFDRQCVSRSSSTVPF